LKNFIDMAISNKEIKTTRKGYTDVDMLFSSIFYETRPFFVLSILNPILAAVLALGYVPDIVSLQAWFIALGFLSYALMESGSNIWNNLNDIEEDAVSKPTTLQVAGRLPPSIALKASFTFYTLGLLLALYFTLRINRPWALIGYLIYMVLSFLYSDRRYTNVRLKARWWAGPGAIGVGFAALSYSLYEIFKDIDITGWGIVVITFLTYLYMGAVKDFRDIEGDRKAGNITPASVNPWGTMVISLFVAWLALAVQLVLAFLGYFPLIPSLVSSVCWVRVAKLTLEGRRALEDGITMMKSFMDLKVFYPLLFILVMWLMQLI